MEKQIKAAEELNDLLGLEPPIDTTKPLKKIKELLKIAVQLIVPEADNKHITDATKKVINDINN